MECKFATIVYVDKTEAFETFLTGMKGMVQEGGLRLVVVDPWLSQEVSRLTEQPEAGMELHYLPAEGAEIAQAYRMGMELLSKLEPAPKYLNFAEATGSYDGGAYQEAAAVIRSKRAKLVTLAPIMTMLDGTWQPYGGADVITGNELVNLNRVKPPVQTMLQAYFFDYGLVKKLRFRTQLHAEALIRFLMEALVKTRSYYYLGKYAYHYTTPQEDMFSTCEYAHSPWWYRDSIDNFIIPLLRDFRQDGEAPRFIQRVAYHLIFGKIFCNTNDRKKGVLEENEEDVFAFFDSVGTALTMIENSIVAGDRRPLGTMVIPMGNRMQFLYMKAKALGAELEVTDTGSHFAAELCTDQPISMKHRMAVLAANGKETVRVRIINYGDNALTFECNIGVGYYLPVEECRFYVVRDDGKHQQEFEGVHMTHYSLDKVFGVSLTTKSAVQFTVPLAEAKSQKLRFFFDWRGRTYALKAGFDGNYCRLNRNYKKSYWMFDDQRMLCFSRSGELKVRAVSRLYHLKREILLQREMYGKESDKELARKGLVIRRRYWLKRLYGPKKRVWLTFDKLYKAGDNGEYLYQYIRENCPDTEIFYLLERTSPDWSRMHSADPKHVLCPGETDTIVTSLLAQVYLATHYDVALRFDPEHRYLDYLRDLMMGDVVCIQHGLTIQKIAQYQNRCFDNTRLYCCASPVEVANISHPIYGYSSEEIKMTGLARYDGLKNNDQKVLLITPTWRRNVIAPSVGSVRRPYNEHFKETEYFRIYNSLINDPKLIRCAEETGYQITYLLHPLMSSQLEDFDRNDRVNIVPATGDMSYEKVLTESSLMVTDYSGVQYDFAYMRKPIVYYHPETLPAHYGDGGMDYQNKGFGPVCKTHEEVVDELCQAMRRQCGNTPEYRARADEFFAFDDYNNCQRIYDTVRRWADEKKK